MKQELWPEINYIPVILYFFGGNLPKKFSILDDHSDNKLKSKQITCDNKSCNLIILKKKTGFKKLSNLNFVEKVDGFPTMRTFELKFTTPKK